MHSNVAQISCLLLEFPLLTLNRQIMAPRPEMCKIEKAVVVSRHYLYCEYCRLKIMLLPNFNNLPAYSSSPIITDPRVCQNRYSPLFDRVVSFPFPFSVFRRRSDLDDKRTELGDDTR